MLKNKKKWLLFLVIANTFVAIIINRVLFHPNGWVWWLLACVYLCGAVTGGILEKLYPDKGEKT